MNIKQIGLCLIFGAGELIWGLIIKKIDAKHFRWYSFDESPIEDEDAGKSISAALKKSSSLRRSSST